MDPTHRRVVNWQRCIRAGGKHNDLGEVGHDHHHHSFFEMLGNWSFKEAYFKVCSKILEFVSTGNFYSVKPANTPGNSSPRWSESRLSAYTSHSSKGQRRWVWDQILNAATFGDQSGIVVRMIQYLFSVSEDHILPFEGENFWEMGETGPCGPCTELHVDRLATRRGASHLVNKGDDSLVEVWNLVFISHERSVLFCCNFRQPDGSLSALSSSHVDTGMGLERLTSILQNVSSNYDTDAFQPIFSSIKSVCCLSPYQFFR